MMGVAVQLLYTYIIDWIGASTLKKPTIFIMSIVRHILINNYEIIVNIIGILHTGSQKVTESYIIINFNKKKELYFQ